MDRRILQKHPFSFRNLRGLVGFILISAFVWPLFVFASGSTMPISIYEPYRIKRNMEYIFLDNPKDYYSYLFGDKLNPLTFYTAYRYFQGKPLSNSQISDIDKIFKNNGNYVDSSNLDLFSSDKAYETWKKERDQIMNDSFSYGDEVKNDNYEDNIILDNTTCPFGTFENATKLLQDKEKTLSSDELKIWIGNQDKIFSSCFNSWASWIQIWRNDKLQITCDDNKLQGIKLSTKKRFFAWLKSLLRLNSSKSTVVLLPNSYVLPFASSGSSELKQDEEMQNALYYYYKAKKEYLCSNIAGNLFKKISDDPKHSHKVNATLGYIRTLIRDSKNGQGDAKDIPIKINQYLADKDLVTIKDQLLVEKEKILSSLYDETEFIKSQKGLENPSVNFIHDVAIFREQYSLLVDETKELLLDNSILANHSEPVRFLYYWNFTKPDSQWVLRVENEYNNSPMKSLWLVLLLREQNLVSQKYIDIALSTTSPKLYYPVLYYAYKDLLAVDRGRALALIKARLQDGVTNTVYDFFSDLIMQNVDTLNEKIQYMNRKPVFLKFFGTYDYGYIKSENKPLETLLNQAGWQDEETGETYYYKFIDKAVETPIDDNLLTFINFGLPIDRLYSNTTLRQQYKEKIFTRAFLLGRRDIYIPLLAELGNSDPLLFKAIGVDNKKTQDFSIVYAILKSLKNSGEDKYGISIHNENYNYGANSAGANLDDWGGNCNYCRGDYVYERDKDKTNKELFIENEKTKGYNRYLSDKEVEANIKEKDKLFSDSLVKMFAEPVLAYMELNPRDDRIPETLSLLIKKMRRWHYRDSDGDWPKKLFQTLQYKYPKSQWTLDTPVYW